VKKRKMENAAAQKLFLALAESVSTTLGPEFLTKLVWKVCGQSLAGVGLSIDSSIPSVEIENGPASWAREHAPNLVTTLGSGYDLVVKESEVLKLLAWRCCPVAEIDLWKSEKDEYSQANAKLLEGIQIERKARSEIGYAERDIETTLH
jgi:hypothetical protein